MPYSVDDVRTIICTAIEGDIKKAKSTFDRLDSKGSKDGYITADDMGNERAIQGLAKKYDANGDGKISEMEYMAIQLESVLAKKLKPSAADIDGLAGSMELSDFKRMVADASLTDDYTASNDDEAFITILQKMQPGLPEIPYTAFNVQFINMYNGYESLQDGEVKELLKCCGEKCKQTPEELDAVPIDDETYTTKLEAKYQYERVDVGGPISKGDILPNDVKMLILMDRKWSKATGSCSHKMVTSKLLLSFIEGNGIPATESVVDKLFGRLVSVPTPAFTIGLIKFITKKLF